MFIDAKLIYGSEFGDGSHCGSQNALAHTVEGQNISSEGMQGLTETSMSNQLLDIVFKTL